jgi:hypothetical protein
MNTRCKIAVASLGQLHGINVGDGQQLSSSCRRCSVDSILLLCMLSAPGKWTSNWCGSCSFESHHISGRLSYSEKPKFSGRLEFLNFGQVCIRFTWVINAKLFRCQLHEDKRSFRLV